MHFSSLPRDIRADAPLWGEIRDLLPGSLATVRVSMLDDLGQSWTSEASYRADWDGAVRLASSSPADAGWSGLDAYGPYWSMTPEPAEGVPFLPFFDSTTVSLAPVTTDVAVRVDAEVVASTQFERIFLRGVTVEEWRDEVIANVFVPHQRRASGCALVIGGSGGGFSWSNQVAALLAASGKLAASVAYFDWEGVYGLPTALEEIPLEFFLHALDRLKSLSGDSDDLAVVGFSKGAEAALIVASARADVKDVVAIAPTAYVWESARMTRFPARSSWSRRGDPIPFMIFDADEAFYESFDKSLLRLFHERAIEQHSLDDAHIPIERISGRISLVSSSGDGVWPSTPMCEAIVRRAAEAGRGRQVGHLCLKGAGHYLFIPGAPVPRDDGTPSAYARGNREWWGLLRSMLGISGRANRQVTA
ncbi:MAG: acyl-CoA thioesterase/BAAT N-terminal domain-containing protein [Actinobacteria bacterium]|nr:acyl-CoA thioesterase/BAAT N-terminal domain-containing protein [Actinomycetota bacterium]